MSRKPNKPQEPFTPNDLQKLVEKGNKSVANARQTRLFGKFSANRSARELTRTQVWKRRVSALLIILVIFLFILYLISMLLTQWGDLVISIEDPGVTKGIILCENSEFKKGECFTVLTSEKVKDVTNITYDWLPTDLDEIDGPHNGRNYLAYTFYLKNNGTETLDYEGKLKISGVAKRMDEAVRVLVYKNGEPTMYAKPKLGTTDGVEADNPTLFESVEDGIIVTVSTDNLKPEQYEKYTIVSWVEGNDPECVNDIMGGYMRMDMMFNVKGEDI